MKLFKGTGVALVTPFHKNGNIDFESLNKTVDHVIKGGVDYLVVMGTTGESATLTSDEKLAVLESVHHCARNRVPVVYGIGGNNTAALEKEIAAVNQKIVSAVLSVSPYYNKPNQRGIVAHYKVISQASPVPVILYNVPGRTGSNMLADTTLEIANACKNVIGIKEASGNIEQVMNLIKHRPKNFLIISGDDAITLPLMAAGADGVISVVANAYPKLFSEMVRLTSQNELEKARRLHYLLYDLIPLLFAEGSPSGIKYVLAQMGLCGNYFRLPVAPISKTLQQKINTLLKEI
jgi:4-hydroxy-tetrahydrodipicolinate synthase